MNLGEVECNSTTLKGCSNGMCHFLNHEATCICNEGRVLKICSCLMKQTVKEKNDLI